MKAARTLVLLGLMGCDVSTYPKQDIQFTNTTGKGGTYRCWIDYVDPTESGKQAVYPTNVKVSEVTMKRGPENKETITDWTVEYTWQVDASTCKALAIRGDQKGLKSPKALEEYCDPTVDAQKPVFDALLAATTTDAGPHFRTPGYVQSSCTVTYGSGDDESNVKLLGFFAWWETPCVEGRGWDSDLGKCLAPSSETVATAAGQHAVSADLLGVPTTACEPDLALTVGADGSISGGGSCEWQDDVQVAITDNGEVVVNEGTGTGGNTCNIEVVLPGYSGTGTMYTNYDTAVITLFRSYAVTVSGTFTTDTDVEGTWYTVDPPESGTWQATWDGTAFVSSSRR